LSAPLAEPTKSSAHDDFDEAVAQRCSGSTGDPLDNKIEKRVQIRWLGDVKIKSGSVAFTGDFV
jgi:hypothetical protein